MRPEFSDSIEFLKRFPSLRRLLLAPACPRRIPVVRQLAMSDCGAAAIASVLAYHGKEVALGEIRTALGSGRDGASAAALLRAGRLYGLRGRAIQTDVDDLRRVPVGSILFWEFRHFVVLERMGETGVDIVDPSFGRRTVPIERFGRAFTGVALVFEPNEFFKPGGIHKRGVLHLFEEILRQKNLLIQILLTSAVTQILSLSLPLLTGILIDRVVPTRDYSLLLVLASSFCVLQLFNSVTTYVRSHLFIHLRTQLDARFTMRFLDHLVSLPYSYFQQHTSGDLMVRLGSNSNIREILTSTALSAMMDGTLASLYLLLLALANLPLTLMIVSLSLARFVLVLVTRWKQRQLMAENIDNQAKSQTSQIEMLSGMETLKAMGLEHRAAETWSNVFVDGLNISIRRGWLDALFSATLGLLDALSILVLMFYGTYLVLNGTFSLGVMMAVSALASGFLRPLDNLMTAGVELQSLEVYIERLNEVMDTPSEQDNRSVEISGPLVGSVALDSISFRYTSNSDPVLYDITIDIPAGMRIAIVGRTGSGKSTLAKLIAGLYSPTLGRILFDGKDLRGLERSSIRSQMGVVTQETQLFGASIRRNIALSNPEISLDRVMRAAKLAVIHEDILAMPMGYETVLADRGLSLSGGQRQRLALARALANDPKVLILDEATSHLDVATEDAVIYNLASLRCTRVVIAHRLSTIRDADLIVVLDRGKIVERGSHDDLSKSKGIYCGLIQSQRSFSRSNSSEPPLDRLRDEATSK